MKLSKLLVALTAIALVGLIGLSGCSDNGEEPTPDITLTADAGTDQTVDLGDHVELNGSASTSSDGSEFNYFWEITSAPSGSTVILSDGITVNPTFTPDEAGTYTISLTISNLDTEDTDEVEITVNDVTQAQEIGGVIDSDMVLSDIFTDPNVPDYIASSDVDVRAQLTIEPGVVIYFDEDAVLDIESAGTLIAEGEESNGIMLTSGDIDNGLLWKGIFISSASSLNLLDYVEVSYAGNSEHDFAGSNYKAAVGVDASGKVSVTNSTIMNNNGYGLYIDNDGGQLENFSGNTFENNDRAVGVPADEVDALDGNTTFANNAEAQVEIFATTYAATKASTWPALNGSATYRVSGDVDIDGELTIAPGVDFMLDEDVMIRVEGSVSAEGTDTDHITFTTSNLSGNLYWKGIYISSASALNKFTYVDLSYAGNSDMDFAGANFAAGIGVDANGKVSVNNSSITNNKEYGLYIDNDGGQIDTFGNNNFADNTVGVGLPADEADTMDGNTTFDNNSSAEVEIFKTNLSDTKIVAWNALSGNATYRVTGDLDINGELTLNPGVFIELDEDVEVRINGAFIAEGTASDNITLTTSNVSGGLLWKGLFVLSSDSRNVLDFVNVSYAGNSELDFDGANFKTNVGINTNGKLTITNSNISNSGGYGIYNIGTLTQSGNTFTNNISGNQL